MKLPETRSTLYFSKKQTYTNLGAQHETVLTLRGEVSPDKEKPSNLSTWRFFLRGCSLSELGNLTSPYLCFFRAVFARIRRLRTSLQYFLSILR